jgi:predicted house-cleaning noncanonical NTP pyrophosphatase (MazG superfamily)
MKKIKFLLDKLGRDKGPELFEANNSVLKYHILKDNDEFLDAVTQKIVEELEEVFESDSRENLIEELADLEEVLASFKELIEVKQEEIDKVRKEKREKKGAFEKRIYCEYVEVEEGSKDHEYFLNDPEKYPEIKKELKGKD